MKQSSASAITVLLLFTGCVGPVDQLDGGMQDGGVFVWPEGTLELGIDLEGTYGAFPMQVQATPGSQGGYHVAARYRVNGRALPSVTFDHRVTRLRDKVLVSKGSRTLSVEPVGAEQSWFTPAVVIFLCPTPVGVRADGETLHFELTASKGGELLGKTQADALFGCPEGDAFCQSICSD